jgi:hypothetical protein
MGFDSEESLKVRAGKERGGKDSAHFPKLEIALLVPKSLLDLLERGDSYKAGPPSCKYFFLVCIALLRCGCFGYAFSHRDIS